MTQRLSNLSDLSQGGSLNPEVSKLLVELVEILQNHEDISEKTREDSLEDVEALKDELAKVNSRKRAIQSHLERLNHVPQIIDIVGKIAELIQDDKSLSG